MKTVEVMVRSAGSIAIWLFVYAFVLTASGSMLLFIPMGSLMRILVGISPVVPVAFVIRSIFQLLQHSDELQQRIQLFAIGFSAAATGLLTFAYGLLENLGYPPMPLAFILPIMVMLWVIGMLYFKWRFR
ncbi:MAG: hypothetical protein ACOYZ6_04540 [Chloroflexota bacterium]